MITSDGTRLWSVRSGQGAPVVFCHGGPGLWSTFDDVVGLLGCVEACLWDQRGCGRSDRVGPYSTEQCVADLDDVRSFFGLDRMVLLGLSWGATLALRYALDHPDRVAGLIYVSGTGIDPDKPWREEYRRNCPDVGDLPRGRESAILQWSADFVHDGLAHAERIATPWLDVNWECNAQINAEPLPDLRERCRGLDVPVLIVDGALDIRPRWSVDSLEEALPRVQRVTLEGAGHLPWTEDPGGFRAAVCAFMEHGH
ncbi:alpha/beta fold hydrolase [Nonomuraea sp. NPDC050536]|uniref:alpha/beta fold hydrolase n=1 Tax=Nonomuraea sp. NPDC050536 TaxID=3364366 RepID=UPI0037CBDCB3